MAHTHKITDHGKTVMVTQIRPGYGVDDGGKEWPLFIGMGQRGYQVKAVGVRKSEIRKAKTAIGGVDTTLRDLADLAEAKAMA